MDPETRSEGLRGAEVLVPLTLLGAVVALVAAGFAKGVWLANAHNGLLALAFGVAGVWTLIRRPWHREGLLFGAVGLTEGAVFLGRQLGHADPAAIWWTWLGVWPVALVIGAITWLVLCFPEGHFLSARWRWYGYAVLVVAVLCSVMSALWDVEYAATQVSSSHPFDLPGGSVVQPVWSAAAHPAYVLFQLSWVVAVALRWRQSHGATRRQLAIVGLAAAVTLAALVIGIVVAETPRAGLLTTPLVPLAAWWAMDQMSVGRMVEESRAHGALDVLTPRENEVLKLMAQGLSNQAIADRLFLSIKTVEPVVSSIFAKLDLPTDSENNKRVLAVLAFVRE